MVKRLDIVVVCVNTRNKTKRCLTHLFRYTDVPFHLWVVDNGSQDGSVAMLEQWASLYPRHLTLLKNPSNLGYTGALQQVYPYLSRNHALAYVNSDVYVGPQWASRLYRHLEWDPKVAAVAPLGRGIGGNQDAVLRLPSLRSELADEDAFEHALVQINEALRQAKPMAETAKSLQGTLWLVKAAAHKAIGGLDTGCICGADDADWSLRARLAGWRLLVALDTFVWHDNHSTFDTLPDAGEDWIGRSWAYFNHKWAGYFDNLSWEDLMANHQNTKFPPFIYQTFPSEENG
ncbi:glycosyltransferase family 2 protein [Alicyclobacillaceae bacterium I2511]|nr:glycosyltransferase family 2 protein [Alicyclobacillaceae bacterium I2511]